MEPSSQLGDGLPPVALAPPQLRHIKAQLDLVLLAIEALAGVGSDAILEAASALELTDILSDRVTLWRLRQASPLRQGQGRKKLDIDEAKALVLVSCYLARQYKAPIQKAVTLLDDAIARQQLPHRVALLGDYLDGFTNAYQDRMAPDQATPVDDLNHLALKLLVDLLFYSGAGGERQLWVALLDRSTRSL